jgi:uncharacterized membrane protein
MGDRMGLWYSERQTEEDKPLQRKIKYFQFSFLQSILKSFISLLSNFLQYDVFTKIRTTSITIHNINLIDKNIT